MRPCARFHPGSGPLLNGTVGKEKKREADAVTLAAFVARFLTPEASFDFLSFDEAERLVAKPEPAWLPVFLVALKARLREGELVGLQWSDLKFAQGLLHIRRTIWRGVEGLPKCGRERAVELPASVVAALKAHRHLRARFVFCQEDGHATIEMPLRYAHLPPEARESAVQQLDRPVPQLHAAPGRDAGGAHRGHMRPRGQRKSPATR